MDNVSIYTANTSARGLQLFVASSAAAIVAAILTGATAADVLVAYYLESVVITALGYARMRRADGIFTAADLAHLGGHLTNGERLRSYESAQTFVGQRLPRDLRLQMARELSQFIGVLVAAVAGLTVVFAVAGAYGPLSTKPLVWITLAVSMTAGHIWSYIRWRLSEAPQHESVCSVSHGPGVRLLTMLALMFLGLAAAGEVVMMLVVVIAARSLLEWNLFSWVARQRYGVAEQGRAMPPGFGGPVVQSSPPNWYPVGEGWWRYWDGAAWTEHLHHTPTPPSTGAAPPL